MTERVAYRQSEVCRMLGINRSTLWRWARAGKVRLVEIGGIKFVSSEKIDQLRNLPTTSEEDTIGGNSGSDQGKQGSRADDRRSRGRLGSHLSG